MNQSTTRHQGLRHESLLAGGKFFEVSDDLLLSCPWTMCCIKQAEGEADVDEEEEEDAPSSKRGADDPLDEVHCH